MGKTTTRDLLAGFRVARGWPTDESGEFGVSDETLVWDWSLGFGDADLPRFRELFSPHYAPDTDFDGFTLADWFESAFYDRNGNPSGREDEEVFMPLIRQILGDRPWLPDWRTESVVGLARTARIGGLLAVAPVLADAMEDAGCDCTPVLDYLRGRSVLAAEDIRLKLDDSWVVTVLLGEPYGPPLFYPPYPR